MKGLIAFLFAAVLLYFPGSVAWKFITTPDPVDRKEKIIDICLTYQQTSPINKLQVIRSLSIEELEIAEKIQTQVEQDSVYIATLELLTTKSVDQ